MMKKLIAAGVLAASCVAAPALAHHSFAMFDRAHPMTWVGTVAEYQWENPHSHIVVVVPAQAADKRTVGRWDIEAAATNILTRQGWNHSSLKPGDKVTIVGYPMKDGTKAASLFYAVMPDGRKLYHDVNREEGAAPAKS